MNCATYMEKGKKKILTKNRLHNSIEETHMKPLYCFLVQYNLEHHIITLSENGFIDINRECVS